MEVNEQNLNILKNLLQNTLSADSKLRKEAENYLINSETQHGFIIVLLHLISKLLNSQDLNDKAVRLAAAVLFKNSIKRNWYNKEEETNFINENDKTLVKTHLIDLMCTAPSDIQRQLAEAVTIISKYDFPKKWNGLLPQLVSKLTSNDIYINKGVMLTANSIMKKFRNVAKSDELFSDIIVCLNEFHNPLLQMYKLNSQLIQSFALTTNNQLIDLENLLETHRLMTRIFYSLNWLDLPEIFEDNIDNWMNEFLFYLSYNNNVLVSNKEVPGPVEKLQAAIIDNLNLYASKYDEEFNPYLPQFTQSIWQLLIQVITIEPKYDILATNAIKFLISISNKPRNVGLFNESIVKDIIENIVIRNIICVEHDEELFNDNPVDYIRKDIEGSDQDSRRRCSIELIRSLLKHFHNYITNLCITYISSLLDNFYINPSTNWKSKDTALHLFLSVSIISQSSNSGAITLNQSINLIDFFTKYILTDLHDSNINSNPIIKADIIKMVCIYRIQFPSSFILELIPHLIKYLNSEYIVVSTYSAYTIEKFLTIKDKDASSNVSINRITKDGIKPYIEILLTNLFVVLDNSDYVENDYVMKCVMRVLHTLSTDIIPYIALLLGKLTILLSNACKNPMNPYYNHYLFESIALIIKSIYPTIHAVDGNAINNIYNQLELSLFPSFQFILTQDIVEFIPYVFQLLAQLLSSRLGSSSGLSNSYRALFPPLLTPSMWERKGNVPALIDLLKAYISVGMNEIIAGNHLVGILGVFQKLLSNKTTEVHAFSLLVSIIQHNTTATLSPYLSTVFNLLLIRMQDQLKDNNKTPKYCKYFIHFIAFFSFLHSSEKLNEIFESLTPGLLVMIILNVMSNNIIQCCSLDKIEMKQMIVGFTRLLVSPVLVSRSDAWIAVLKYVLLLVNAESGKTIVDSDDLTFIDEEAEAREFDSTYSKLLYATLPPPVSSVEVAAASAYFIKSLAEFTSKYPGQYTSIIQTGLDAKMMTELQELLQLNGVTLM